MKYDTNYIYFNGNQNIKMTKTTTKVRLNTQQFAQTYYGERGYREMLQNILDSGYTHVDRTGVGRRKLFSQKLVFDLQDTFPLHSSRPCPLSFAFKEYQAFLSGRSDIHDILSKEGIDFWKGNTSREFLDKVGLTHVAEGNMAKAYGFQLRNYNGDFDEITQQAIPDSGVDQIKEVFESLKKNPFGSRHYVTMWNPAQLQEMALPPCWHSHQWLVIEHEGVKFLNLEVTSRSADTLYGTPFNIQQYAYLLMAFSEALEMTPALLTCELIDAHLYENQIEFTKELLTRKFSEEPCSIEFKKKLNTVDDIISLTMGDITVNMPDEFVNKDKFVTPKPPMAV
ncbi:thymidylate synthase [Vibrio parahaemolyticus]|uniref:Thymidylate synthase n=1 Tax=Vibrio parahaemolyticus TaxID=670 RepID=A0AAW8PZP2_VIBPH|nr:thymidylate synthase [Vibrio parahaemolyticus]EGR2229502.1 thymidylate synthase [Vibrio parahaemolyticus]MDS1820900.1 thymidylate synthase [Vibrio parahaemolyticus]